MTSINAGMLALHRRVQERTMPDTAVIVRPIYGPDGQGGVTETGSTTIATVACRLMPANLVNSEREQAERIGTAFQWYITMPQGTDVGAKDRIVVNGTRTFEVVGVLGPHAFDSALRVAAVEIL